MYLSVSVSISVMFLHVSVCPQGDIWAGTPPAGTPPLCRYIPWEGIPPRGGSPRTGTTPWAGTPPGQVPPGACWEIRATSGRYASYWNAFLYPCLSIKINTDSSVDIFSRKL